MKLLDNGEGAYLGDDFQGHAYDYKIMAKSKSNSIHQLMREEIPWR